MDHRIRHREAIEFRLLIARMPSPVARQNGQNLYRPVVKDVFLVS